ncbi:His-Xaa-Ser system radical SAM maturase HxsC [Flavisphingomonas formosensis]|uniref:His-Xaa-Ser system radical SAM maturase HxsC n=1 Tax=Flavisphingomonas formosensis TaxID=861534 RepID=UPI0012F73967|nr:His-Xaa-Ser system radical SAM maturase HxsC [Sphingomonas formosensis]
MIRLTLPALAEAERPFVTRLRIDPNADTDIRDSLLVNEEAAGASFSGARGLIAIDGATGRELDGDVILVQPAPGRVERLLRAGSRTNSLLVTERCDQLCVMCSQPPKKTHVDRFALLEQACLLAPPGMLIGISGGEPTLYKEQLFDMVERVLAARDDLAFHILTNAQHFTVEDAERLRSPLYARTSWGIPLYATDAGLHDRIVGKAGAFDRLERSLATLILAGARVELRTVLVSANLHELPALARYVAARLRFVEAWSIMQLEHIGFAKGRWHALHVDHRRDFAPIAAALDQASLHGIRAQLFNFPRCTVPPAYRSMAIASISDWKRKYMPGCAACREQGQCSGFFEWHPDADAEASVTPL